MNQPGDYQGFTTSQQRYDFIGNGLAHSFIAFCVVVQVQPPIELGCILFRYDFVGENESGCDGGVLLGAGNPRGTLLAPQGGSARDHEVNPRPRNGPPTCKRHTCR